LECLAYFIEHSHLRSPEFAAHMGRLTRNATQPGLQGPEKVPTYDAIP